MSDAPDPTIILNHSSPTDGHAPAGDLPNRRASYRARIGARALVREPGHAPADGAPSRVAASGLPVAVADVSRDGIGFRSPRPMEAGLTCRLTIPESQAHQNREIAIVFCRPENGQFFVGAKFAA